jgi:isocitrate lyase
MSVRDWYAPIVADAEAGFGGALNCFEIMKVSIQFLIQFQFEISIRSIMFALLFIFQAYIESGVAGVHFEDQLGSEKKCGHMGLVGPKYFTAI